MKIPSTVAQNLPADVLKFILDHLYIDTLVHASHVCRTWRTAALEYPTYWPHGSEAAATVAVAVCEALASVPHTALEHLQLALEAYALILDTALAPDEDSVEQRFVPRCAQGEGLSINDWPWELNYSHLDLHVLQPQRFVHLRKLRLSLMRVPDAVFESVEHLAAYQCLGLPVASLPHRFPNLREPVLQDPHDEDDTASLDEKLLQTWFLRLNTIGTIDGRLLQLVTGQSRAQIILAGNFEFGGEADLLRTTLEEWVQSDAHAHAGDLAIHVPRVTAEYGAHPWDEEQTHLVVRHLATGACCASRLSISSHIKSGDNGLYDPSEHILQLIDISSFAFLAGRFVELHTRLYLLPTLLLDLSTLDHVRLLQVEVRSKEDVRECIPLEGSALLNGLKKIRLIALPSWDTEERMIQRDYSEFVECLRRIMGQPLPHLMIELKFKAWSCEAKNLL
ncbi:hypothetical protein BKA62DRAFT_772497 [Auriculariales sp. MPI-PUGE-AT-0066]|nr:hypothetical protein BKA62DRAFT_772497 [Auriculariales sp. MPI-PUGE-AT-0066]